MSVRRRYLIAGCVIIACLLIAVTVARAVRGGRVHQDRLGYAKRKGPDRARVHLIEYSDFQCPACERARGPVEDLRRQFENDLQVEFRHYPLERPLRWAMTAALFAECAAGQGKFCEYHDRPYGGQAQWAASPDAIPFFVRYAEEVGLAQRPLEKCLADPKTLEHIRAEHASGEARQIQSTPTIFINEHRVIGASELTEKGKALVEEELNGKK